jgi:glycosyltransferase involved in cell wall biosynthesis
VKAVAAAARSQAAPAIQAHPRRRIRIAFLTRMLVYGGAERQLVTLAKSLPRDRFEPIVLCFYPGGPLARELHDAGIEVISLDKRGRWDVVRFLRHLTDALDRLRPDVVHGYLGTPNLAALLMRARFPHLRVVWGVRGGYKDYSQYDWFIRAQFRIECLTSRFADLVIMNSRAGRDFHIGRGFSRHNIHVIPNGIDTERFRPDEVSGPALRRELEIPDRALLIGLVARLDPIKQHEVFLRAAADVAAAHPEARFVCVGDGPPEYAARLRHLGEELGLGDRVRWLGERPDMPAVYNALDVLAACSYGEGFPNVIAEAMACQVPCVVTDVGDAAWIVGSSGIVVPPRDPAALARGLREMIARRTPSLAVAGRRRIVRDFPRASLAQRTAAALISLRPDP